MWWRAGMAGLVLVMVSAVLANTLPMRERGFGPQPQQALPSGFESNWGSRLNPGGRVPAHGYRAVYFNRRDPATPVFAHDVADVAIKYAWADFHQINSPDFGAYWVGRIDVAAPARKQITVSQSWAKSRILIDGQVVWDKTNSSGTFVHDFTAGAHVVEVQYVNNWHTVEFKVTIGDIAPVLREEDVSAALQTMRAGRELYYAGVYESAATDTRIDVTLPASRPDAVLWLSSYEAVDWTIRAPGPIVAVVSSYAPGSRVTGAARVLRLEGWRGPHTNSRRCSCHAGSFHCEGADDLADAATRLQRLTGRRLTGYAMRYSTAALTMLPYDRGVASATLLSRERDEAMRRQCRAQADPDFDRIFD